MAKSTIAGTYKIHVGNYDWGCSVDKAILTLDREMGPGDIGRFTDIRVRERKLIADESGPDHELSEIISETKLEMEELDESSLEWVAAAQQSPSLQGMMRMKKEEDRK